ncbi:MAG: glycoside hydrolase family 2 [Prevotella sp.]|nr:glycoside hydrolase family 2 [Prevotella sp.]
MMKKYLSLLASLWAVVAMSQTEVNISGQWKFFYAACSETADSLVNDGFYASDYNTSAFNDIKVPSCWAVLGYEEPVYRGFPDDKASEGLYVKHFSLPASFNGKRVLLHFGGVWASAEVWLNGQWIGRHDSGYTSFSFDVTGKTHTNRPNVLAVRVRQVYPGYKTDTYDDWTLGGIYRDVTLQAMPRRRWIDRVTAITDFDTTYTDATLTLKMMVADDHKNTLPGNYRSPGDPYQLHAVLTDNEGNTVFDQKLLYESHTANYREQQLQVAISNAHKWTAETPYLYTLRIDLIEADTVMQTYTERIGLRKIETTGGVLRLNGQPIKLRGVNRHDEWPTVGRATTHEHWLADLTLMKQANINYIRAAHYQHAKGFIELCDSIGMYVGEEVSLGGAGTRMFDPSFVAPVLQRTYETVCRDRNNPSIIYWSVGNEDPLTDLHLQAVKCVKALDPTRPVCLPWDADETLPDDVDILAPHYWTAAQYDSIASHSSRPIITTEYVHAYGEMRFGGLEDCWQALTRHPAGAGGAVWMWADQGIHTPTPKDTLKYKSIERDSLYLRLDGAGWDGITDSYRHPTRDFEEVKAVYCPISIESLASQPGESLLFRVINGYDFLTTEGISIHYHVFVDDTETATGTAAVNAPPHGTDILRLHNTAIPQLQAGQTAYVQFFINDATGHELGRKAIAIAHKPLQPSLTQPSPNGQWPVFNETTGLPIDFSPAFWHKLNEGDQIIRGRINGERYTTHLRSMTSEDTPEGRIVRTEAVYTVNDSNRVEASYTFIITPSGTLQVSYAFTPYVTAKYLPVIGISVQAEPLRWLGLGPQDAYPNKKSAPILGVYDARQWSGTRAARWIETTDGRRITLTPQVGDYAYIDRDNAGSNCIRILSHVLGRSEKGRLNDPRYQIVSGQTYQGQIRIDYWP